ncbi:type IV pili methyl-accepting chemotaxis transducer N-terminal domain-containing protein [Neolewinella litorea]|uniref:NarX-like N-terminal domain-containing protein n=1 Tax=Neolewinella litorea TaxID=2562452 RepID=A0A4S4NNE4_9BACT|nr:type IV pili methyl-accepting chemotaxis transducer N-terminal domain-containing protein [Neolewinella litorea]THH40527.1 hypothetical protein E4021_07260 [Neolewinella litorea]
MGNPFPLPPRGSRGPHLLAIFLIAVLLVVETVLVDGYLMEQRRDAEIINVAGRQRMLSQRIAKLVALDYPEVGSDISEWRARHDWLKDDLAGRPVHARLLALDSLVYALSAAARAPAQSVERGREVNQLADEFLLAMDAIVDELSLAATNRADQQRHLDYWLTGLALGILLLDLILMFRPWRRVS